MQDLSKHHLIFIYLHIFNRFVHFLSKRPTSTKLGFQCDVVTKCEMSFPLLLLYDRIAAVAKSHENCPCLSAWSNL